PQPLPPIQPLPLVPSPITPVNPLPPPSPAPQNSASSLSTASSLPSLTSIPLLRNSADWVPWESAVVRTISAINLRGHICRIPKIGDLMDPTSPFVVPPPYDFQSTQEEVEEYRIFWRDDDIADHILVGRLAHNIAATLPPKRSGPYDLPNRTARDTLFFLRKHYSVGHAAAADNIKSKVISSTCHPGSVPQYVSSWQSAASELAGSEWDFTSFEKTQKFVNGLPSSSGWMVLRDRVRAWWHTNNTLDDAPFTFDSLASEALDIYQSNKLNHHRNPIRNAVAALPPASNITTLSESTERTRPQCSNCRATGHTIEQCWQKGGGMEGQRDTFRARPKANIATDTDILTTSLPTVEENDEPNVIDPAEHTDSTFIPAYTPELSEPTPTPFYTAFIQTRSPNALASISSRFNAILDSGCTTHIFRDKEVFWTYDTSGATPVGTANCGTLNTLARGEVRFRAHSNGLPPRP
ncbi:hypothetical protein C0991_004727, partial [Blastosporella zonata]